MIKSMSGFASLTCEDERATVSVTVRAVNHRFLDLQLRVPQAFVDVEPRLRAMLQKRLARGRVELGVSVQLRDAGTPTVEFNLEVARALAAAVERARDEGLVSGTLTAGDLLRVPQALTVRDRSVDRDSAVDSFVTASIEAAVERALGDLDAMRVREGVHLEADLDARRQSLAIVIEQVRVAASQGREALERRLLEKVAELRFELPVDHALIAQEVVRAAGRSDISEEVTRFRAHLAHWRALSEDGEPCGRKLDFLLQEMHREINTIGSKADGLAVSELIIGAKAELERMREQVQNVE